MLIFNFSVCGLPPVTPGYFQSMLKGLAWLYALVLIV